MTNLNILPIRLIMIAKDLNETELAKYFGVTSAFIIEILSGKRTMDNETLTIGLQKMNISFQDYEELRFFCEELDNLEMPNDDKFKYALMKVIDTINHDLKDKTNNLLTGYLHKPKYGVKELQEILGAILTNQIIGNGNLKPAEDYLTWLNGYAKYCIPELKEEWLRMIKDILYQEVSSDYKVANLRANIYYKIETLYNFMNAGEIMQVLDTTKSWEEVEKTLNKQGHTDYTLRGMISILIIFWPYGPEFVDRYSKSRLERDKTFSENYANSRKN